MKTYIVPLEGVVFYEREVKAKDKKSAKWGSGKKLETLSIDKMPKYISQNLSKYRLWLDLNK